MIKRDEYWLKAAQTQSIEFPKSINLHLTERCNYGCRFCFSRHCGLRKELNFNDWKKIIEEIISYGCEKINFAGGEPTLIPFLPDLIEFTSNKCKFTSIISNGTGISQEFLNQFGSDLKLVGLSIDSANNLVEKRLGRTLKSEFNCGYSQFSHVESIKECTKLIHECKIPLKINTVLLKWNVCEDFHELILSLNPIRWKVLEMHRIDGINSWFLDQVGPLQCGQIDLFRNVHSDLNPVIERTQDILESYCMITPDGRFYQDTNNRHHYSRPILKIGAKNAISEVIFSEEKYLARKGGYFEEMM